MKELKWLLFGVLTAGVGFWIYKNYKKDSEKNIYFDGFSEGYTGRFSAISSPNPPKKYGEIALEIQQKQIQNYKQINANYQSQREKLKLK